MIRNCWALALFMICTLFIGCENAQGESNHSAPSHDSIYDPNYDILPVAGIRTEKTRAELVNWNVSDIRDSVFNVYRIPQSVDEFNSQASSGLWRRLSNTSNTSMYFGDQFSLDSKNWQYKCWVPFYHDTVTFTQGNGPPEELALALKYPLNEDIQVDYKINYSDWQPLIRGRDYGILSLDSIQFPETYIARFLDKNLQLTGVNLLVGGKNFISESNNTIAVRISKNAKIVRERTFYIKYSILGFSSYESDSVGKQVDTSLQIFNRHTFWNGIESKTSFVFFGYGNVVSVKDIQVKRTFQEALILSTIADSNLYLLKKIENCSDLIDNGWCMTRFGKNTLLKIRLRRDLFSSFTTKSESRRSIAIRGNIIVTEGFAPNNPPFLMEYPLFIDD